MEVDFASRFSDRRSAILAQSFASIADSAVLSTYAKQDVYNQVLFYKQSGLSAVCFLKTISRIDNETPDH